MVGPVAPAAAQQQPDPSTASSAPQLEWKEQWPEYGVGHGLATGIGLTGALTIRYIFPDPEQPRWTRDPGFDRAIQNVVESPAPAGRSRAAAGSDLLVGMLTTQALVVDPWAVGGVTRQAPFVAAQTSLIGAQAYGLNMLTTTAMKRLFARRRPDSYCADHDGDCSREANLSFPSGHASAAFTGAGLICAHHMNLDLYNNKAADVATCATGLGMASTTAFLRMAAGKHHITDVLAGAGLGLSFGWLLPKLLHYRD